MAFKTEQEGKITIGMTNFQLQYSSTEIQALEAEYLTTEGDDREMLGAGKRVLQGDRSRTNLEVICRWKSPRRIALLSRNTDDQIEHALSVAVVANDIRTAVQSLTRLHGVGVKMASAILTAIDPSRYTVLDYRALEALGVDDNDDLDFYIDYIETCRSIAQRCGATMRALDRANWQWSKRKSRYAARAAC